MSIDLIEQHIPRDGIFRLYHEYTGGNEICPRFRFFSLLGAMGSIIKRHVYFQRSTYNLFPTLYPNPWIILVAPQGRGHKSAALSIAKKLVQKLPENLQPRVMASKLTPEALVKSLAAQSLTAELIKSLDTTALTMIKKPAQALLYSSELGVLLGKEKYNQGMIALLTDLYDTPNEWYSETVMRGDQRLYDVCLSIMGASTPDWMQTMLPSDAFKGGFMSRMLLIGFPENWFVRIADPPPGCKQLEAELIERLTHLAKFEGEMKWNSSAKDYFNDWYISLGEPEPGPKAAYLERKQDHVLRIAILLELAKNPSLTLTRDSLESSLKILEAIEPDTLRMVEYISIEPRMRIAQRALEFLQAKESISEGDLLSELWKYLYNPREFQEVMDMLVKTKRIDYEFKEGELWYRQIKKEDV